ncbi:MAG TPA: hypothetical protein VGG49_12205 [Steroidobacteraceae bacterium]|jgi:hypothetical protein
MASQSNPGSLPSGPDLSPVDSPSADDLLALVPDMELLETSAVDARAAHAAEAASGAARKPGTTPTLTDHTATVTMRLRAAKPVISDDPYAHLMPEPEALEEAVPLPRAVPPAALAGAPSLLVPPLKPQLPAPEARDQVAPPSPPGAAPKPAAPLPTPPLPAPASPAVRTAAPARPLAALNPRKLPNPETVAVPPVMDREFIARNRIVELYLAGSLPVRGATVFERFCRANPQILDEIGLPERVHAALRLLEASGMPEPWQEKPRKFWERPYVPLVLAGLIVALGIGILVLNSQLSEQMLKVAVLHKLVLEQPLDAATGTSTVEVQPTHVGPAAAIATVIGGAAAQLVNIKLDMTHSDFRAFRITIDRVDQGRVAVFNNLIRDSNGELGFSLNSSALGAGTYQLTIEGLDWRGDPQPDSWAAIILKH